MSRAPELPSCLVFSNRLVGDVPPDWLSDHFPALFHVCGDRGEFNRYLGAGPPGGWTLVLVDDKFFRRGEEWPHPAPEPVPPVVVLTDHGTGEISAKNFPGPNRVATCAWPGDKESLWNLLRLVFRQAETARRLEWDSRLHQEELRLAYDIQNLLFPARPPVRGELETWFVCHPLDKVNGDYFDYREYNDGLDFVLADVSGHGVPAAFIAVVLKMTFDFYFDPEREPRDMMEILDRVIFERSSRNFFVTGIYGRLDYHSWTLEIVNAGHHPPLFYHSRREAVTSGGRGGLPLGIFFDYEGQDKVPFGETIWQMGPGDAVLLFTDGLVEYSNPAGSFYGRDRLKSDFGGLARRGAREAGGELLKRLDGFGRGTRQVDDMTAVIFSRRGGDEPNHPG